MDDVTWSVGDRVRHSLMSDWGLGEVREVLGDGKVRVCFLGCGEKLLKNPPLIRAEGADLVGPPIRPPATPRIRSASRPAHLSIEAYREAFVEQFPQGFADPKYLANEREYKVRTVELLKTSLSPELLQALVDDGCWEEISERALVVMHKANLVFPNEIMAFRDGLVKEGARERLGRTLLDLLYGSGEAPARFEQFCVFLADIEAAKWTVATYFPFFADPTTQMFLKPIATQRIAGACGVELNYNVALNPLTYASLLTLSARLMEILQDLGPKDMIDVQSFIWCVAR